MSPARPRLFFSFWCHKQGYSNNIWCCLSSTQPHNPDENSSIAVENSRVGLDGGRDYLMKEYHSCAPVSGLIFCPRFVRRNNLLESRICNPTTGKYVDLPKLIETNKSWKFFGYDPIGKQYKILSMSIDPRAKVVGHLLTFPCEKNESWRSIQCPTRHRPFSSGICINGILYYVGRKKDAKSRVIVCFDVRSEEFKFIDEPEAQALGCKGRPCLSNFNGKLVSIRSRSLSLRGSTHELYVWVLEDEKKPEWSKHVYRLTLPYGYNVVGMIGTGEIVFSVRYVASHPFYVLYFNPERKTLKKVTIQGIEALKVTMFEVTIFLDHVENVSFIP